MEQQKEYWAIIKICPDYSISSLGRVKNRRNRIMKLKKKRDGYICVNLTNSKLKKRVLCVIHRQMAIAFIPKNDNDIEVHHLNCLRDDNRIENLEWVSKSTHWNYTITNLKNHVKIINIITEIYDKNKNIPTNEFKNLLTYYLNK